ncbi:TPA: hypothetical protein SUB18_000917 [Streptococcus equi subsp. zooepidemicus]|nr:hypothetical protein [Streptococcus equi subsp. zooepidemicus]
MTEFERFMLSTCFWATLGWIIGIYLVHLSNFISSIKRKLKERKERTNK